MFNTHLVYTTSDTDCDGTLVAAHRITVPTHLAIYLAGDLRLLRAYADARGDHHYIQDAYKVETEQEFRSTDAFRLASKFDREYFATAGYMRVEEMWNPWVYDESIGIPALDHTMEDLQEIW